MLLPHGPASDRNLFSRLHWPQGRSIPGRVINQWLIWDINNFILPCVHQRCWMVCASSGRLDHIGRLEFSRCQGWKSISVSRGSSGLPRALRNVLDVATSLRMSAGAMLLRTGSQSVLVHRTAPVMILAWCYSVVRQRDWYVQSSSKLEHSTTQPQNSRGPMLMYEDILHLLPILYQLACAPNCYEFGFLRPLSEDGVCRWACSQVWHQDTSDTSACCRVSAVCHLELCPVLG